jgi:hypothetical protein
MNPTTPLMAAQSFRTVTAMAGIGPNGRSISP